MSQIYLRTRTKRMAAAVRLFGLVLCGGLSTRMGSDKGSLTYGSQTQRLRCTELLQNHCEKSFVSCRAEQRHLVESELSVILDSVSGGGPGVGILSAHALYPDVAWLVLACDFPFAEAEDLAQLVAERSPEHAATCFVSGAGFVEPLFSIWEPSALAVLRDRFEEYGQSPSRILNSLTCKKILPLRARALENLNS